MLFYLPATTTAVIKAVPGAERHPGLQLDKFSEIGNQETQKTALDRLVTVRGDDATLKSLLDRMDAVLDVIAATKLRLKTSGPLTLHLSRASALENAGICLHPLYGFVYLPGSGLKGMARAYAETVWKLTQPDSREAERTIQRVFGNIPGEPRQELQHVGSIVFHDAWPESWPKLTVDITNNHHPDYYEGKDAPGDWEDPVPVYFLAVGAGNVFNFAISKRRDDADDNLIALAREWLTGALCYFGVGAKTNAGYGCFVPVDGDRPSFPETGKHETFECEVELVTPAFLAGAGQQVADCELRPATLRGQLRWWWRTMHAGHLQVKSLRLLESILWGDTNRGGLIQIHIVPVGSHESIPAPGKSIGTNNRDQTVLRVDNGFLAQHEIIAVQGTQPLHYASYGMDEMPTGQPEKRKRRFCMTPGARWGISIRVKEGNSSEWVIPATQVLEEAKSALGLLCTYGGVGAKCRKGFGSLKLLTTLGVTLESAKEIAAKTRKQMKLAMETGPNESSTPHLENMLSCERALDWRDPWRTENAIGSIMVGFAQAPSTTGHGKHCREKMTLGLPRQIHGPLSHPLGHQQVDRHSPPERLESDKGGRFTSPVFYHVDFGPTGNHLLRVACFPSPFLPNLNTSKKVLTELVEFVTRTPLPEAPNRNSANYGVGQANRGGNVMPNHNRDAWQRPPVPTPSAGGLMSGKQVQCVLLEEKTKKGGWKAKHEESGRSGPIQNSVEIPADKNPGDRVELIVATVASDGKNADFKWPTK